MRADRESLERFVPSAFFTLLLVSVLLAVSHWNYLLFHSVVEFLSIVAAFGTFMVAWNTRRIGGSGYLLFLGQAFLCVGILDLLHTLAYKGMGVFPGHDANLPTQLWIAARALESLSLLLAPLFVTRAVPLAGVMLGSGITTVALAGAVFSGGFPDCFVEGRGLTAFKVASEYVIILGFLGALALLARRRDRFDPSVFRALALALLVKVGAELSFTLYTDVYGFTNLLGHLLKLVSFVLVYQALVETGIARPFELLFRTLKLSEAELQSENRELAAAQDALRKKNQQYAELIAEKNQLLGIAAHDIRSPLSAIQMYSSFLARNPVFQSDQQCLKCLETIQRTNRRALDMVNNVLDLTAIESGKLQLEPRPLDLRVLVEEGLEGHRALAAAKGVEIDVVPGEPVPPACADPLRFEQVLANLVSNAVKFSPAESRVSVRVFRRDGSVGVAVEDQGSGIPPEDLQRIFLPFTHARTRATSGEKSTGLGLAIVHKIVASHGGSVEVDSVVGRGSTFTVFFPVEPGAA